MGLYEREHALSEIDMALREAGSGRGQLVAVEGPPGIGKTALLIAARERARESGFEPLCARGGELEVEFPFGVVRQLFESRLASADESERAALLTQAAGQAAPVLGFNAAGDWEGREMTGTVVSYPRLDGLYWLASNLASAQPLLLVIDDAQWADAPSLAWLDYLVGRIDAMPILVVIAFRPLDDGAPDGLVQALLTAPGPDRIAPEPLSPGAARALVHDTLGEGAEDGFCQACWTASGGNPFYLRELLADLARSRVAPADAAVPRVGRVGPDGIALSVQRRLAAIGDAAVAVARAIALLGASAEHRHVATLLDVDEPELAAVAAQLVEAGILEDETPLRFSHPVVREAVYKSIPRPVRYTDHVKAAQLLADDRAEPEQVAVHLLKPPPAGDPWVVQALRRAATSALSRGAPAAASTYLRRALKEAATEDVEVAVLAELGHAEIRAGERTAVEHLEQALAHRREPGQKAEVALELGRALTVAGRLGDASQVLSGLLREESSLDPDTVLRIKAALVNSSRLDPRTRNIAVEILGRVDPNLAGTCPGERLMLAHLAYEKVTEGAPAELAADLARRALRDGALLAEEGSESPTYYVAAWTLGLADRLGESAGALTAAAQAARAAGSALGYALALSFRASVNYRLGALAEAEADARNVAAAQPHGAGDGRDAFDVDAHAWHPLAVAFLVDTLVERGRLDEAENTLRTIVLGLPGTRDDPAAVSQNVPFVLIPAERVPETMLFNPLLYARSSLRFAQGQEELGAVDLRVAGARAIAMGVRTAAIRDWRSAMALSLARRGQTGEARRLASEELTLAEAFGAPRPLGIALRAVGLLEGGNAGESKLMASVDVLRESESRLEFARSLIALGAARRRGNRRSAARDALNEGLEIAHVCGADALVAEARSELRAAGSRPRSLVRTGVDALTASELRVARLAAGGMRNREIAQSLFVTNKTVEFHLGQVYSKLNVSRAELRALIPSAAEPTMAGDGAPSLVASGRR